MVNSLSGSCQVPEGRLPGFFNDPNLSAFIVECNAAFVTSLKHLLGIPSFVMETEGSAKQNLRDVYNEEKYTSSKISYLKSELY